MRSLNWPGTRKQLALLAVVVLVLSAGCLGLGGDDGNGNDTLNDSDDGSGDESTGDSDPALDDLDPVSDDVTAEEVFSESISELESTEEYSYAQQSDQSQTQGNQTVEGTSTRDVMVDTTEPAVAFEQNQTSQQGSTESEGYLLDDVAYTRSDQNEQQYGSAWIQQNISEDFDTFVNQYDITSQLTVFMSNSSATLEGETTYEGERVYVLTADVDETALNEYYFGNSSGGSAEFTDVQMTVWVSAESNQPVRIDQTAESTSEAQNTVVESAVEDTITLDHSAVDITLPEEAENAPDLAELQEESA
ncbi:hypothetical protein [Halobacteriaceae bacterium SHR40]|uniref:hypothetical protein n=1 Tax=Halovenus amylolytica TaxID=2500550 RepID=UPI000FE2AB65